MNAHLYIIRGLPDSGKTTFGNKLANAGVVTRAVAADDYFYNLAARNRTSYAQEWNPKLLGTAHVWCQSVVNEYLSRGESVAVCNTFTTNKEMKAYFEMAARTGAQVTVLTVERNSTITTTNGHGCPPETVERMARRWEPNRS